MSDSFAFFGFPYTLDIDLDMLRDRYLALQKKVHPDRANALESSVHEAYSARLNEAYQVMKDPFLRAKALLIARGGDVKVSPDSVFLAQILDDDTTVEELQIHLKKSFLILEKTLKQNDIHQAEVIFSQLAFLRKRLESLN